MLDPWIVQVAGPHDWEPALRLIFQHLPEEDREVRVANARMLLARREIDPQGLTIVRRGSRLMGAMVSMFLPGATGLVWLPQAATGRARQAIEDHLVRHACSWLRQGGAKMAQAIVLPTEALLAEPLVRNGFRHLTALWYLRHDLSETSEDPGADEDLHFQAYSVCDPALFASTLVRTYEGTLDCPEVNGVRTNEEIIIGHQGQGTYDPNRWWLVWQEGAPAGVLILAGMPEWQALDIAYLGVVPEARRRGLGRALTHRALAEARNAAVRWLTLAVDHRNRPAWKMYLAAGFVPHEEREVYLAILRP